MNATIGGRAFVPELLETMQLAIGGVLTAEESERARRRSANTILEAWPLANAPLMAASRDELVQHFRWVGPLTDGPPLPTEPTELFRGQVWGEPGMAWTTDELEARSYAAGWATEGRAAVYRAFVLPEAVLARFRAHSEVVVDPNLISRRQVIRTFEHFRPMNPFEYCEYMWAVRPLL